MPNDFPADPTPNVDDFAGTLIENNDLHAVVYSERPSPGPNVWAFDGSRPFGC